MHFFLYFRFSSLRSRFGNFNWENSLCSLSKTTSLLLVTLERVEEQTTAELISSQTFQIEVFLVEFQVTWGISFVLIFSYIQNIAVKTQWLMMITKRSHVKIVLQWDISLHFLTIVLWLLFCIEMRLLCSQNLTLECRRHDTQRDGENQAKILQFAQQKNQNPSWQRILKWHFRQLSFSIVWFIMQFWHTNKGIKERK